MLKVALQVAFKQYSRNGTALTTPPAVQKKVPGRSLALAALSGLLLAGALPGLDWGGLAWVGLVPFLCLFPFRNARSAFGHGLVLGIFYLGVMAYWIIVFAGHIIGPALSTLGWVLITLYQAFYLGVWASGAQWLHRRASPWAFRLGAPALWAVVEWGRQSGALGLGWGDLAYTQHLALPILQVTKLTGIWGLAFLIVLVNAALCELWQTRRLGAFSRLAAALLLAALGGGVWTMHQENLKPTFVAAALQGNIDQNTEQTPAYSERVMQTFTAQGRTAAARGGDAGGLAGNGLSGLFAGRPGRGWSGAAVGRGSSQSSNPAGRRRGARLDSGQKRQRPVFHPAVRTDCRQLPEAAARPLRRIRAGPLVAAFCGGAARHQL